jgi:hypothetical protein
VTRTVYDELATRLLGLVHDEAPKAAGPKVTRGEVVSGDPLVIDLGDELLLEEGDPDVEFGREVLQDRPAKGDVVRVHSDGDHYIVAGVIE